MRFISTTIPTLTLLICASACSFDDPGADALRGEAVSPDNLAAPTNVTIAQPVDGQVLGSEPIVVAGQLLLDDPELGDSTPHFEIDGEPVTLAEFETEVGPTGLTYRATLDTTHDVDGLAPGEHELCTTGLELAAPGEPDPSVACIFIVIDDDPLPPPRRAECRNAVVPVDGSCSAYASVDDGDYAADELYCETYPAGPYPVGVTDVTMTCTDPQGLISFCDATVEVVDGPTEVRAAESIILWPPDHDIHEFGLEDCIAPFESTCGGDLAPYAGLAGFDFEIVSLTSDEAENDIGDGNTCEDTLMITGKTTFSIRSERQGGKNGRVYHATYRVSDGTGYLDYATCEITVPTSHGKAAIDSGCALCVDADLGDGDDCGDCPSLYEVCG